MTNELYDKIERIKRFLIYQTPYRKLGESVDFTIMDLEYEKNINRKKGGIYASTEYDKIENFLKFLIEILDKVNFNKSIIDNDKFEEVNSFINSISYGDIPSFLIIKNSEQIFTDEKNSEIFKETIDNFFKKNTATYIFFLNRIENRDEINLFSWLDRPFETIMIE